MSILLVSPEVAPFSKTGGLADATSGLARALARAGHDVTLVTPRYRSVTVEGTPSLVVRADLGGAAREVPLREVSWDERVQVLFVDYPPFYDRDGLYGEGTRDYPDNAVRFALLARAAVEVARRRRPSVVHAHEWQTGLVPVYLREAAGGSPGPRPPVVFTIHNLAYQGLFPASVLPELGVPWELFTPDGLEYWGQVSLLKAGIVFSDWLTTVSPRYAQEIVTPQYGFGFDGILAARRDRLVGVLNGIDEDVWDPARDPLLPAHYSASDLSGKRRCKAALLEAFRLPASGDALQRPLIGMVSRLVDQKGFDLVAEASEELPRLEATWVLLGSGEAKYEALWRRLAARFPDRIGVHLGFDERLAHLVEAGSDLFLMPSRFEPCGLNQLYSLRYGTVPIVRATGGLADTVVDVDERTGRGTGFIFEAYTPEAMFGAIERALRVYQDPKKWARIVRAGMRRRSSWDESARAYVTVYRRAMRGVRMSPGRGAPASGPAARGSAARVEAAKAGTLPP